jgi:hypothetical protein
MKLAGAALTGCKIHLGKQMIGMEPAAGWFIDKAGRSRGSSMLLLLLRLLLMMMAVVVVLMVCRHAAR